ncbi:MAG TPA: response regulator [Burkholderiales bacterium]|nr:response regulator [Burkholderiales bacterium]
MAQSTRVLIVEDDADVRDTMAEYLSSHGFAVDTAEGGDAMRAALARNVPQLVLLDLMLPGEDGLSLARSLRERHDLAIIMVTAADSVVDRVVGLEVGADDYIAKPFDLRELLARVKSVLRRARPGPGGAAGTARTVSVGGCSLDLGAHRLLDAAGAEVPLTSMEFDLLRMFVEHPNQVLSRDQLLNLTRNRDWEPFDRSIDIRIARLRRKLGEDPAKPRLIKTVRGAGYCYVPAK